MPRKACVPLTALRRTSHVTLHCVLGALRTSALQVLSDNVLEDAQGHTNVVPINRFACRHSDLRRVQLRQLLLRQADAGLFLGRLVRSHLENALDLGGVVCSDCNLVDAATVPDIPD